MELAIVMAIIGLIAAMALPYFKQTTKRSQVSAFLNDLRIYTQQFDSYELELKRYPPQQLTPGQYPVGMEGRLSPTWLEPSPIGGTYRWVYTSEANLDQRDAYIDVVGTNENPILLDASNLNDIDQRFDDGNPSTGNLRVNGLNLRYYVRIGETGTP